MGRGHFFKNRPRRDVLGSLGFLSFSVLIALTLTAFAPTYSWIGLFLVSGAAAVLLLRQGEILIREEKNREQGALHLMSEVIEGLKNEEILRSAERLRAEYLETISHEFRNPLTAIHGFSKLLLESDSEKVDKDALRYIYQGAEKLRLVLNHLTLYRLIDGNPLKGKKLCRPQEILEIISEDSRSIAKSHALQILIQADGAEIEPFLCDSDLLSGVLLMLISQASENATTNSQIQFTAARSGNTISFSILWIPRQGAFGAIGDVLHQLHSEASMQPEVGDGVTIAARIAALHGGRLALVQTDEEHAAFVLSIPVNSEEKEEGVCPLNPMH